MAEEEVTLAQAAVARGLNRRTLQYAALQDGRNGLRARRLGSFWVTRLSYVDDWLRRAAHRPGPAPRQQRDDA